MHVTTQSARVDVDALFAVVTGPRMIVGIVDRRSQRGDMSQERELSAGFGRSDRTLTARKRWVRENPRNS